MTTTSHQPLRVLFLCTGNSARSQIAETILNRRSAGRFLADSAGSAPAAEVNPLAIEALERYGLFWTGHPPQNASAVEKEAWDFVITVCDRAKESCPIFPGQPVVAHWGMEDPAAVTGTDNDKRRAFDNAILLLSRRIDLFLALPVEKLERLAFEGRVGAIGGESVNAPALAPNAL